MAAREVAIKPGDQGMHVVLALALDFKVGFKGKVRLCACVEVDGLEGAYGAHLRACSVAAGNSVVEAAEHWAVLRGAVVPQHGAQLHRPEAPPGPAVSCC